MVFLIAFTIISYFHVDFIPVLQDSSEIVTANKALQLKDLNDYDYQHVVKIEMEHSFGSGVIIAPDLILTNYHVLYQTEENKKAENPNYKIKVLVSGENKANYTASLVNRFPLYKEAERLLTKDRFNLTAYYSDIAILKLDRPIISAKIKKLPSKPIDLDYFKKQTIQTAGYPGTVQNKDVTVLSVYGAKGPVKSVKTIFNRPTFMLETEVAGGMSGSPVIVDNKVVGLINSSRTEFNGEFKLQGFASGLLFDQETLDKIRQTAAEQSDYAYFLE